MSGPPPATPPRAGSILNLLVACALLTLAVLLVAPLFAWYAHGRSQSAGVTASFVAAGVCWLGGTLALVTAYVANRYGQGIQGVLAGMFFRMGLPLVCGLVLERQVPSLAAAGFFSLVLGYYLFVLPIETLLSLRFVNSTVRDKAATGSDPVNLSNHSATKAVS